MPQPATPLYPRYTGHSPDVADSHNLSIAPWTSARVIGNVDSASGTSSPSVGTQPASSPSPSVTTDPAIWGSLIPLGLHSGDCSITRVDFRRPQTRYTLGRGPGETGNDFSFPDVRQLGITQCAVEWDGDESSASAVTITDLSHGSTWINGDRIQHGVTRLIRNYNIITIGGSPNSTQALSFMFQYYPRDPSSEGDIPQELRNSYDIQLPLGRGAYATVVKALHVHEKQWYAIKLLSRRVMNSVRGRLGGGRATGVSIDTLKKEIDVLSRLRHRNIVAFKEAVYGERSVGIVMEFVSGGDLGAYMTERRVLQEREAKYFTRQLCRALAYLHGNGVVHRDLKPENVLLTNGIPREVKVADFGMAKVVHSMTCLKTQCGTPLYMAPEISDENVEQYDEAVDSWSLGVMVCVMLWGRSPFSSGSKEINWNLSQEFGTSLFGEDFLRHLLNRDPQSRMSPERARRHPWLSTKRRHRARPLSVHEERVPMAPLHGTAHPGARAGETWVFPCVPANLATGMCERRGLLQETSNRDNHSNPRPELPDSCACSSSSQNSSVQTLQTPSAPGWTWSPSLPDNVVADILHPPFRIVFPPGFHVVQEANITTYRTVPELYARWSRPMASSRSRIQQFSSATPIYQCEPVFDMGESMSRRLGAKRLHLPDEDESGHSSSTRVKRVRTAEEDNG